MGYTPYFVGPFKVGLERDMDSYLIPEDAYPDLENAYLWRGRIYKKGGSLLLGRLGIRLDILTPVRGAPPQVYGAATLYFPIEPGSLVITDGITTFTDNGLGGMIVTSGLGINGTINYVTGVYAVTFTGVNAGATVTASYFIPVSINSPVMGLRPLNIQNSSNVDLVAFDLQMSYIFNSTTARFDHIRFYKQATGQTTSNLVVWTGNDVNFFFSTNYQGALFATNGTPGGHFYAITAIVPGATTQITTDVANNFAANDVVYINNVAGVLIGGASAINNKTGVVTVPGNPFTVAINTAGATAYTNGGVVWSQTLTKTVAVSGDGIRWYDRTGWVNFAPALDDTPFPQILQGALLFFAYKDYFIAFNTTEGSTFANKINYTNRARWSTNGPVFYSPNPLPIVGAPPAANINGMSWYDGLAGAGHVDAPTNESIVAAEFIKDTLVVYFESSTYRITFIDNPAQPFTWEKINTEIGAVSTFSTVPFDRGILSVGKNGIYTCDSVDVDRIDRIIPDEVFNFGDNNTGGHKRVHGVRDFFNEMAYFTYVDSDLNAAGIITSFPNRMLIYNYLTGSYAIFSESHTCFGRFQFVGNLTWATATIDWDDADRAWNSFFNRVNAPIIVAGNQQGYVVSLEDSDGSFFGDNAISLSIQSISTADPSVFTVINHNLDIGDHIVVTGALGVLLINGIIFRINTVPTTDTFTCTFSDGSNVTTPTYSSGGKIRVVDDFNVTTKNLNPFFPEGKSMRLGYVDFYFDNIPLIPALIGEPATQVDLYLDDNSNTPIESRRIQLTDFASTNNDKFWTRVYFQSQGQFLKLKLNLGNLLIFDEAASSAGVVLHGMILWMKPTGRMLNVR